MAFYRALETSRPPRRRLFTDPFAKYFLSPCLHLLCRLAAFVPTERLIYHIIQHRIPGALASGLARTRYIDDLLKQTITGGARQVIILGAGYDTRSLRLPGLNHLPVIEIDHADTSAQKRRTLKKAGVPLPQNTCYLTIDFNRQNLEQMFHKQGVDLTLPTTFIWEDVTNYLQKGAIDATLTLTSKFPAGSTLIFTYIDQKVLDEPSAFFGASRLLKDLNELEEKWTFGFVPEELASYLRVFGWKLTEDQGAASYRQRLLGSRKDILKGYEFYHVAMATRIQ